MSRKDDLFASVKTEGALLTSDILKRVAEGSRDVDGIKPQDYHLPDNERISTAVSRAWTRLRTAWTAFKTARASLGAGDVGTGMTREKWLLQVFQALEYGRLQSAKGVKAAGKEYPISHMWRNIPIHLVGFGVDLDHRQKGVIGAAKISPHGLIQDYLNQEPATLWGFVSNGLSLRLLRDNVSMTRQAYVEFDLESMFEGDLYADFHLLWMLCHQSRVEAEKPEDCWLEKWSVQSREQGIRVLDTLRDGVQKALEVFGQGYLAHPANTELRERLRDGRLDKQDYYRQLLRLVYRLLFLFVAEDRQLLFDPLADENAKARYREFYSMARLRRLASQIPGSKHGDLYRGLVLLMGLLHEKGCKDLGIPALNSFLWSIDAIKDIWNCEFSNRDLLKVIRSLAYTQKSKALIGVDYRNLGAEELGSVYESLLELQPKLDTNAHVFELVNLQGNERKSTGSYYTPTNLINQLLKSALDPVLERASSQAKPEQAILSLKVCDPSCGSGHFLVAAAYRIAKRLAMIRTGDIEPSPESVRHSLRDVISHCIYGVDLNEMAVELCKVSLWMEGMEPGKPLSFLDHRIQCGNSLIGAVPSLVSKGIPDEAFESLEGDDKKLVSALRKRNKQEREYGQTTLEFSMGVQEGPLDLSDLMQQIAIISDDTVANIQDKAKRYQSYRTTWVYQHAEGIADAWCSAFLSKKDLEHPECVTHDLFKKLQSNSQLLASPVIKKAIQISRENKCFHWHLAFPDVFKIKSAKDSDRPCGWSGGFDVVIGNPPWEKMKLMEIEFFSAHDPSILFAQTKSERKKLIDKLIKSNPTLYKAWKEALHDIEAENNFMKNSDFYKHSIGGELNTSALFCELALMLVQLNGYSGLILKSTIATGDTYGKFFGVLVQKHLVSFFDFKNWARYFPAVGFHERYALVTLRGFRPENEIIDFGFQFVKIDDLSDDNKKFNLTSEEIKKFSPNSGTCPLFTDKKQKSIAQHIYSKFSVLVNEENDVNPWSLNYIRLLDMSGDSNLFVDFDELTRAIQKTGPVKRSAENVLYLPLYEGKYIQQFDYRFSTFKGINPKERYSRKAATLTPTSEEKMDPDYEIEPRYWVQASEYKKAIEKSSSIKKHYVSARLVTNVISNGRSVIACVIPAYPCNNLALILDLQIHDSVEYARQCLVFTALLNSYIFDFTTRLKMSENLLKSTLYEVACPSPEEFKIKLFGYDFYEFCLQRSFELSYVTNALSGLAEDLGKKQKPFIWNEKKRLSLRCELDAMFFHFYGIKRPDVEYILETFPIIKSKEEDKYGEFLSKKLILDNYDKFNKSSDHSLFHLDTEISKVMFKSQPFQRVSSPPNENKYKDCVPLLTLQAAAGGFRDEQSVEFDSWVRIKTSHKLVKGMFVAQTIGKSMEPGIPDGSYCLFRYNPGGTRQDKVVLVQHHDIADPDTGGSYTVKRYTSKKKRVDDHWEHAEIRLLPDNPAYNPIVLKNAEEGELKVIAEFIEVLK